ncbi:hypothetical protein Tco_1500116 [Tanacetum coccineum]
MDPPEFTSHYSFTTPINHYQSTNLRPPGFTGCLKSLSAAHYDNEKVNLHIYVDHFKVLDQTGEDLDKKLNKSRMILDFVDGFEWRYGEKMVHYRTGNVGLQAQWLEAWWPSSDDEFAFVVEDDIELSPLYYRFLKGLIVEYYYNALNYSPWVYGASLQRPRFVPALNVSHTDAGVNYGKTAGPDPNLIQESSPESNFLNGALCSNSSDCLTALRNLKNISFRKEIAVKAYVTKKALEMKYDTWVLDHGMIPVKAEFFLNWVKLESAVDFYRVGRLGLLFAKSSGSGIWDESFCECMIEDMPESI